MSETGTSDTGAEAARPDAERHEFGAEVGRLLDLVVHSLYSEREIFLRELVANAADATDRRRFEALTDKSLGSPEAPKVRITPDKPARTITITDDGIGMGREELVSNLGTIARSGSRLFGQALAEGSTRPEDRPALIGQFGVGFYSAFMVADRVEVTSRRAGAAEAWLWESDGRGSYTLAPAEREAPGTTVVLHVKGDADEFLDAWRLESIVRKWADGIALPVAVVRDGEERVANEGTALWRRPKSEVTTEQYQEVYRHVAHAFDAPWATLHWRAEGALEFAALLFVPGMQPFEAVEGPRESRVRLHVRRMFITDEAELLPPWLRFVQGVVDTDDLPLNVSREMLQATPVLARIRKAVTNRVLSELRTRAKDAAGYAAFWDNFGAVLKEGVWEDAEHRKTVAELMRFRTSRAPEAGAVAAAPAEGEAAADGAREDGTRRDGAEEGDAEGAGDAPSGASGLVSLAEYVGRMRPGQEAIYFLAGENRDALAASPQLEGFRARGVEVLLLDDPVDSFWPERLGTFEEKPLRSVTQGAADLSKLPREGDAEAEPEGEAAAVDALLPRLKEALGEAVAAVRATDRLTHSAVVLAASENGPDLQMQRLMRRASRPMPSAAPVLEVNPRHPLLKRLAERAAAGEDVGEAAQTLLDLARVQDGEAPRDPAAFARRVTEALVR